MIGQLLRSTQPGCILPHSMFNKYGFDGTQLWTRGIGTPPPNGSGANGIAVDATGVYVTAFYTPGSLIGKFARDGTELWSHTFGPWGSWTTAVAANAAGVYVAGETWYQLFPGLPSSGTGIDAYLVRLSQGIVNVNSPPIINSVTGPSGPLALGSLATVSVNFTDADALDTHTCTFAWDDGMTSSGVVTEPTTSSPGQCMATHTYSAAGVFTVGITVTDNAGASASAPFEFVVVYDPSAGFVTGGGWIDSPAGAYTPNPGLTGKATFGFVSKYLKGANAPTGQTEFQFHVASFNFQSSVYEWLVVSGAKAQYKGTGTVNGAGNYGFLLTATDGQLPGGGGADKFRIKIWDKATDTMVYDNVLGASDDMDNANPQVISGGSIVIHRQ